MTQEDKELLLIDLSVRLPYGVKVNSGSGIPKSVFAIHAESNTVYLEDGVTFYKVPISRIKPYLRPMSSMTDEEMEKVTDIIDGREEPDYVFRWDEIQNLVGGASLCIEDFYNVIDWLNKNHFDYRGFIEMRLALEAPEGMYKTN